jgi:hypothetical protein
VSFDLFVLAFVVALLPSPVFFRLVRCVRFALVVNILGFAKMLSACGLLTSICLGAVLRAG